MLFSDSYFTVRHPAESVFKDRGSKFLAYIFPVSNESEIKERLVKLRKEHPSANHHCYAWRLGPDKAAFRANDDGEPSNSAGKPILGQIQAKDLTNVLIVVVRYFGGTLLGVGGLINAYKTAASEVIEVSAIEEKFIMFQYQVEFDTADTSAVMRALKENEARILTNDFVEKSRIVFQVKKAVSEALEDKFQHLYATRLTFVKIA